MNLVQVFITIKYDLQTWRSLSQKAVRAFPRKYNLTVFDSTTIKYDLRLRSEA